MGTENEIVGILHWEANTELRHPAFSQAEFAGVLIEERKGMEGEHTS